MHPKDLSISDFTYHLPDHRIAKYPLTERDSSKLLVYEQLSIHSTTYRHLANELPANSLLVFNNTKVVEARLLFQKSSGTNIELFCLEPANNYPDITTAMLQKGAVQWKCLVGGAKKWKTEVLVLQGSHHGQRLELLAEKITQLSDCYLIQFTWNLTDLSFAEILHLIGNIPLPPYLNRQAEENDKSTYQTIYASTDGSVAAPTAGLHFTRELLASLQQKGIFHDFVTLHVGAGTFKPVKAASMQDHEMHAEYLDVSIDLIKKIQQHTDSIIPVGTTSMRTLESLYWIGLKVYTYPDISVDDICVAQWEPYEHADNNISTFQALDSLQEWMKRKHITRLLTKTQIIIAPGYRFRIASALITNFHQPQSTLLLLVAALIGNNWKKVYGYALEHDFRFLSYGDGCLLWLEKTN